MRDALRSIVSTGNYPSNVGLAYDVWAPVGADGKVPDDKKDSWFETLATQVIAPHYEHAFKRWKTGFSTRLDRTYDITMQRRLLVGSGNPSATEIGLTVHHTWGVPVIPGSSLKGLLAHYVETTYGPAQPQLDPPSRSDGAMDRVDFQGVQWQDAKIKRGPGKTYRALFGAPEADETDAHKHLDKTATRGLVTFHDALYDPGSVSRRPFARDVLTPHQATYHKAAGTIAANDYDDPIPVNFLSVKPGTKFLIALNGPPKWTELAAALLQDALDEWGVGAKTSSGYGRAKPDR